MHQLLALTLTPNHNPKPNPNSDPHPHPHPHPNQVAACINFSCDPNLDFYPVGTPHGDRAYPRVGFFARRTINKGDELGYQRDKNSFSMRSKRENGKKCECGAKGCCGWV